MSNDENNEGLNKKAIIVVMFPVLIVAVFLVLFFTVFTDNTEEEPNEQPSIESNVEITEAEQLELEGLATSYIQEAGNFGVRADQVTAENIDEMATLLETDPQSSSNYFTSRSIVYEGLDQFIYEGSPLHYPSSTVEIWSDEFETTSRASFTVDSTSITADANEKGAYIQNNGENLKSVTVNVNFTTTEKMFIEQGSEIGAERSYSVMEKEFDNTASFIFVYEDHEDEEQEEDSDHSHGSHWKLYNIKGLENEFVLASWNNPSVDEFSDTQFNFVETDRIVPSNQNIQPALPEE